MDKGRVDDSTDRALPFGSSDSRCSTVCIVGIHKKTGGEWRQQQQFREQPVGSPVHGQPGPLQSSAVHKYRVGFGQTSKKADLKRRVTSAAFLGQPSSLVACCWSCKSLRQGKVRSSTEPKYRYSGRLGGGGREGQGRGWRGPPNGPGGGVSMYAHACECESAWQRAGLLWLPLASGVWRPTADF